MYVPWSRPILFWLVDGATLVPKMRVRGHAPEGRIRGCSVGRGRGAGGASVARGASLSLIWGEGSKSRPGLDVGYIWTTRTTGCQQR